MVKRCVKCKGRLVQGAETCIICGKPIAIPVAPVDQTASIPGPYIRFVTAPGEKPVAVPVDLSPSRPPAAIPSPYIHFVTAPGGRRIEDSSTAKSYNTR